MTTIYTTISHWKIKPCRIFSIISILICSFSLVKTLGENQLEILFISIALILFLIPFALNPKNHLQALLAPMKKLELDFDAYFNSITKADHLLADISLYFFFLWIITVIIY